MGKASSAKKIARAARAGGGRVKGLRQRNLLFPGAIMAIVFLGTALVAFAWAERSNEASSEPPTISDHWHASYGVYICDAFQAPAGETSTPNGVHTHGDGVVHIHPHSQNGAGDNATLGLFLEDMNDEITDDSLTYGEDQTWTEGEDKCGEGENAQDAELVVAQWRDVQAGDTEPALITRDLADIRFREDGEGYTIAFVPEGTTDIPKPESSAQLSELGAADLGGGSTTVPGAPGETPAPGQAPPPAGGDPAAQPPAESTPPPPAPEATTAPEGGG
jgi:hypothetical protein